MRVLVLLPAREIRGCTEAVGTQPLLVIVWTALEQEGGMERAWEEHRWRRRACACWDHA